MSARQPSPPCVPAPLAERAREAYEWACRMDLAALKPGNVGLHGAGHEMQVSDFEASTGVTGPILARPDLSLGERIYEAVDATVTTVGCNTNLGIVLLCAPLMQALTAPPRQGGSLRARLRGVLRAANAREASLVYEAIQLAAPAGLGRSAQHDVATPPKVGLREAMQAAVERDRIAYQYASDYADVFDYAVPRLLAYRARWRDDAWAAVAVFLGLLRRFPDSHIVRQFGAARAREVSARAARLEAELDQCRTPAACAPRLSAVDAELKQAGINPGTTADLTVATLLVYRLEKLLSSDTHGGVFAKKTKGRLSSEPQARAVMFLN